MLHALIYKMYLKLINNWCHIVVVSTFASEQEGHGFKCGDQRLFLWFLSEYSPKTCILGLGEQVTYI